MTIRISN